MSDIKPSDLTTSVQPKSEGSSTSDVKVEVAKREVPKLKDLYWVNFEKTTPLLKRPAALKDMNIDPVLRAQKFIETYIRKVLYGGQVMVTQSDMVNMLHDFQTLSEFVDEQTGETFESQEVLNLFKPMIQELSVMGDFRKDFATFANIYSQFKDKEGMSKILSEIWGGKPLFVEDFDNLADVLIQNPYIEKLEIDIDEEENNEFSKLAEVLKTNKTIKSLVLRDCSVVEGIGIRAMFESLKTNETLKELTFPGTYIKEEGAKALGEALAVNKGLESLDLYNNGIGTSGAEAIAKGLALNKTLKVLSLSTNKLGDQGAKAIAEALKRNSTLQDLDLYNNEIGEEGAVALAESLKENKGLKTLRMGYNPIGDQAAVEIADALTENGTLEEMDLHRTEMGGNGGESLAIALKYNSSIKSANFDWNPKLTDKAIKLLEDSAKFSKGRVVKVSR